MARLVPATCAELSERPLEFRGVRNDLSGSLGNKATRQELSRVLYLSRMLAILDWHVNMRLQHTILSTL
jgi:hypothetical protein